MKLTPTIILSFLILNSFGQAPFAIIPLKTNVVYIGIDNPVMITIGKNLATPIVTVDNGEIDNSGGQQYIIRPNRLGYCTVTIKDGTKVIFSSNLKVKSIPEPEPYVLDSIFGGYVTLKSFKFVNALRIRNRYFEWDLRHKVKNFVLTRVSNQRAESINNQGEDLSTSSLNLINNAQQGDIYIFDSIVYESLDTTKVSLKSLVVRIE
jgi:hypothetical protein